MSEYKPIEKLNYTFYKWIHTSKIIDDLIYVGSTANLSSRKRQHKHDCNNPNGKIYNNLLYSTMREYGGIENFKMVILGTAEQITKREAQAIEEQYRINEKATLNSQRCYITKEDIVEQRKQYYQDNKQALTEQYKQYQQNNKQAIKQYYQDNKQAIAEKHKQYYQVNKQALTEKQKQYYQDNKETIKQYQQNNKQAIAERQKQYYQNKKENLNKP